MQQSKEEEEEEDAEWLDTGYISAWQAVGSISKNYGREREQEVFIGRKEQPGGKETSLIICSLVDSYFLAKKMHMRSGQAKKEQRQEECAKKGPRCKV